MTEILHHSGTNTAERKKIEAEQEAWRSYYAMFADERKKLMLALSEKDQALSEKDQLIEDLLRKLKEKGE